MDTIITNTPGLQAPLQSRSQKTMQRIMDATIRLLDTKNFDDITINEIVEHADCSVGSFYARFKDKDTLLHALDEVYIHTAVSLIQQVLGRADLASMDLRETVHLITANIFDLHNNHRGLMRTLILAARNTSDPRFRQREMVLNQELPKVFADILSHRNQIHHPNPEIAVHFGFLQMLYSLREMVLWDHLMVNNPVADCDLVDELVRGYLAYLQFKE